VKDHRATPLNREKGLREVFDLAHRALTESFLERTAGHRLRPLEGRILAALGEHDAPLMSELARRLVVKQPTLSKAIDRMAAARLVRRRTPADDHRLAHVHLTDRGLKLATKLVSDIRRYEASIADVLGKVPLRKLKMELTRLINLVEQVPPWAMRHGSASILSVARTAPKGERHA
jgi:MarR family transcriptional regulator, lower aerobic nicotinate degradation pathway regulator